MIFFKKFGLIQNDKNVLSTPKLNTVEKQKLFGYISDILEPLAEFRVLTMQNNVINLL